MVNCNPFAITCCQRVVQSHKACLLSLLQLVQEKWKYLLFKSFNAFRAKNSKKGILSEFLEIFMKKKISWYSLVLADFNYMTDFKSLTLDVLDALLCEYLMTLLIHLFIPLIPLEIIVCLLHHINEEHEQQRRDVGYQKPCIMRIVNTYQL